MSDEIITLEKRAEQLAVRIESLVAEARKKVATVANTAQVYTYYEIGRYIVEDEQGGKIRAEYGKGILQCVSERLTERLGKGWSVENLRQMRKFFVIYFHKRKTATFQKSQTLSWKLKTRKSQTLSWKCVTNGY